VGITSRADRDIQRAAVRLDEQPVLFAVEERRQITGSLVVMKAGSFRFELEDSHGERWSEDRSHPVQLELDRSPEVVLQEPASDRVVREGDVIELKYNAKDDFGLEEVRLVFRVAGRAEGDQRRVLKTLPARTRRVAGEGYRLDLASLKLVPGDQLQLYVEATDNDTVLGPKLGRSATRSLKIFSAEEHHQDLIGRVQAAWEKLLARLAENLEQEPSVRIAPAEDPKAHLQAFTEMGKVLGELGKLDQDLSQDRLAWAPLRAALGNIRRGLGAIQRDQTGFMNWADSEQEARDYDLKALAMLRARRIAHLERDVVYLEDLLDLVRLEELGRIAKSIDEARGRLAELIEKYQQAPSDEARRKIEAEIAALKQKVAQLMARQAEVLKGLRDEYFNPEALKKALSERDLMGALDRIQQLINEGKIEQATAELAKLMGQMKQLQAAIDKAKQGFGKGKYSELAQAVNRIQGELNQIAEQQRRVMDATGRLRRQVMEELKRQAGPELAALLEKLRQRLKGVLDTLQGIPGEQIDYYGNQDRNEALELGRGLDKLLAAGDLAGSLETAGPMAQSTARLAEDLKNALRYEGRFDAARKRQLEKPSRDAVGAAAETEAIRKELERLLPRAEQLLDAKERAALDKLKSEQAELGSRAQQLRQQMDQANGQAPLFGKDLLEALGRGRQAMRQASSELGRHDPRAAYPHQQSALSELERLQQGMKKSCQGGSSPMPLPMGSSASGEDGAGEGFELSQEQVEIPKPEDFQAPEAFRKDLLDGMKDPVPEGFKPQVKKYYEELVK
jgi:ElaB/YqjD/DUF883 family membrane-anchored ribosome-binding protein/soluble cytochrome b562